MIKICFGVRNSLFTILAIIVASGCAATGPAFQKIANIPADQALIYIYRPETFRGSALTPEVVVNNSTRMPLRPGAYYPYFSNPGNVVITIYLTGKKSLTVDLKPGETYYIRGGTVPMGMGYPSLRLMTPEQGLEDVKQCRRQTLQ